MTTAQGAGLWGEVIARLERGENGNELNMAIHQALTGSSAMWRNYISDLNAARSFVPEGCGYSLCEPHGARPYASVYSHASDDTGCWGECVTCGHRAGFVDRATLRRYADAEVAREMKARAAQVREKAGDG